MRLETLKTLNAFDNFLWAEDENTKKTQYQFRKDFELYKRSFNLLCKTINNLCELTEKDPSKISTAKKTILMITIRIAHLMQSIRVLNLKGYYCDMKVLERCLLESVGLCAYFALNEKETENWIRSKDSIAKIRLVDYLSLLLGVKGHSGMPLYGNLSKYVHTYAEPIAFLIVDTDREAGELSFAQTPIFDKEKVSEISWMPTLMLAILRIIFRDELTGKRNGEIIRLLKQYDD